MSTPTLLLAVGLLVTSSVAARGSDKHHAPALTVVRMLDRAARPAASLALACDADVLLYNYKGRRPKG